MFSRLFESAAHTSLICPRVRSHDGEIVANCRLAARAIMRAHSATPVPNRGNTAQAPVTITRHTVNMDVID